MEVPSGGIHEARIRDPAVRAGLEAWRAAPEEIANLDRLLDEVTSELSQDEPILVELVGPAGDLLSVGIGADESVLTWVQASEEPPYLASLGDEAAPGTIVFYLFGELSEFPRSQCIPVETARQAAREFLATAQLPSCVRWVTMSCGTAPLSTASVANANAPARFVASTTAHSRSVAGRCLRSSSTSVSG